MVETIRLESGHTLTGIGGSNPPLSARYFCYSGTYEGSYRTLVPVEEPLRKVRVNLTKYVATEAWLRYCPAVITQNGRIKQDIVVVNGKEERHPEGAY